MREQAAYIPDVDLGILGTVEIKVEFDYTPEDNGGRDYPSSHEDYDINKVYIVAVSGFKPLFGFDLREEVEEVLIDVTALECIDEKALIDLIKEQE